MQAPLEVVRREEDVAPCLERLRDCDLILVDTIGQSPRGDERLGLLDRWLRSIQPDETHLVIDANCSLAAARACLHAFSVLRPTACILSKVDEVSCAAPAMGALLGSRMAMSYVTTGQLVPDDLVLADTEQLANWLSGLAAGGVRSVISSPTQAVA
jgi:flagellar biosynthesis protein FlhF